MRRKLGLLTDSKIENIGKVLQNSGYKITNDNNFLYAQLESEYLKRPEDYFTQIILLDKTKDVYKEIKKFIDIYKNSEYSESREDRFVNIRNIPLSEWLKELEDPKIDFAKKLYSISALMSFSPLEDLEEVLKALIDLFFKCYPEGSVWIVPKNYIFERRYRAGIINGYIIKIYGVSERIRNKSVRPLDQIQSEPIIRSSATLIDIFLSLFYPYFYGFACEKIGAHIIFQFDKPYEYKIPSYPDSLLALYRRHANLFEEDLPFTHNSFQKDSEEYKKLSNRRFFANKWNFSNTEIRGFIEFFLKRIDNLIKKRTNLCSYLDEDDTINPILAFEHYFTFDRIIDETLYTLTMNAPFLEKILSFGIIDKYSELIIKGNKKQTKSPEEFKNLFTREFLNNIIIPALQTLPSPFSDYFTKIAKEIYDSIYKSIKEGVWMEGFIENNNIKIIKGDLNSFDTLPLEEFTTEIIRTLRNTYHGYMSSQEDKRFLKYLSLHTGNLSDYFSYLPALLLITTIQRPDIIGLK